MVESKALIRLFKSEDEKYVKYTLGLAAIEGLPIANQRATLHPLTISIWVVMSCIMVQLFGWWPIPEYGFLGWLAPLPAFGCWGFPILFGIDWINRPYFEEPATDLMYKPDFTNLQKYYSRSASSGLFILEYGSKFIGVIAIDASKDSESEQQCFKKDDDKGKFLLDKSKDFYAKGTSSVATIRHFYVEMPYRKAQVEDDLLAFAVRHVFTTAKDVETIKVTATPLVGYTYDSLRRSGFTVERQAGKLGIFGWRKDIMTLERARWEKGQSKEAST